MLTCKKVEDIRIICLFNWGTVWRPLIWKLSDPHNLCTEDWTSQKTWCQHKVTKSRSGLCALDKHTCVHIKNMGVCVCVYICYLHKKKLDQSINYLVNRRKCLIITWSPSMHNVCKKKKKLCNAFLFCLWVKLLKVKSNKFSITVQRQQFHVCFCVLFRDDH